MTGQTEHETKVFETCQAGKDMLVRGRKGLEVAVESGLVKDVL